jgi:hypothetical protein
MATKLEDLAVLGGVGLTPHAVAVDRALAAVAAVNDTIAKMSATGEMREWNRECKAARAADPSLRYFDFIEKRKVAMLEALAQAA